MTQSVPAATRSFDDIALSGREREALISAYVAVRATGRIGRTSALGTWAEALAGRNLDPLADLLRAVAEGRPASAAAGLGRLRFDTPAAERRAHELSHILSSLQGRPPRARTFR